MEEANPPTQTPSSAPHHKVVRGLFAPLLPDIRAAIAVNMAQPGPYASENAVPAGQGRFFDDYVNWRRLAPMAKLVLGQPALAALAAGVMGSNVAQFFHDHVLYKAPGTSMATPWHADAPYYFFDGQQTLSMWIAADDVAPASTLRVLAGSHRWGGRVRPVSWADNAPFYRPAAALEIGKTGTGQDGVEDGAATDPGPDQDEWLPVPRPEDHRELDFGGLQAGDALLFHFCAVHGARGNTSATPRRALSLRWLGDDAHIVRRPGRTSPPLAAFPGIDATAMVPGRPFVDPTHFPILWPPERAHVIPPPCVAD